MRFIIATIENEDVKVEKGAEKPEGPYPARELKIYKRITLKESLRKSIQLKTPRRD